MPVLPENTTAEHIKLKKHNKPTSETRNQTQHIKLNKQSKISTLLLSTTKPTTSNSQNMKKNTNFASTTLRTLSLGGCTAADKVDVPMRNSADDRKNKQKKSNKPKNKNKKSNNLEALNEFFNGEISRDSVMVDDSGYGSSVDDDDVWCGPRIGFSAARKDFGERVKIDAEKISHRERPSVRRTVNPETISFLDSGTAFVTTYADQEVFGTKYYRHPRHPSPEDYAEIMMLQRGLVRGNRLDMPDRYSAWRLDVDNMSYEELLELGDRIGYVNTGLKENEVSCCLRRFKLSTLYDLSRNLPIQLDRKCSICQEEYEADDEIGKLNCGHGYHIQCIKQWLANKNTCPVCKTAPVAR